MRWRASAGISARSYARRSRWEDQPGGRGRRCSAWVRAVVAAYAASAARLGLRKIAPSWSATMRPWECGPGEGPRGGGAEPAAG